MHSAHVSNPLVGRFAPSPTGRIHAGNIFAYLVAWIVAKRSGGHVLLRIEDLDSARSKQEWSDQVMCDFELLGLDWKGDPLFQSARSEAYESAYRTLVDTGGTYPCFCTRADIMAASAPHAGQLKVYPGTCRSLSRDQRTRRILECREQGREPSVRLALPNQDISFEDEFQGFVVHNLARDCGDCIIRRADGAFAYQLAVVVDDFEQGVTSVVRGCDLLASTAVQIHLLRLLAYSKPEYAHVPLITDEHGRRIAKREKDAGLDELIAKYGSAEGVLGHVAFVTGLIPVDEPASAESLLRFADLESLRGLSSVVWS